MTENPEKAVARDVGGELEEDGTISIDVRDATNPAEYVETAMRGQLGYLAELQAVQSGGWLGEQVITEMGVERIAAALEMSEKEVGAAAGVELADAAEERIDEFPICVEVTTTFEIVLGIGGPDDRLLVECNTERGALASPSTLARQMQYEIRRVLYRYSWGESAEIVLHDEDQKVAEAFARRVVPELDE